MADDIQIPEIIVARRASCEEALKKLSESLSDVPGGCIYVTGSVARGEGALEGSPFRSDLDVFLLSDESGTFKNLEQIVTKAELIKVCGQHGFPRFSGDGKYLVVHDTASLLEQLGTRNDEAANTFTARLLLLLESKVLVGRDAFDAAIERVLDRYWRDYTQNQSAFLPVFLLNDISRYWKTLCLSYESGHEPTGLPDRTLKNYKLKYSRCLMCYSAVLFMFQLVKTKGTMTLADAKRMVSLTPTQRLEELGSAYSAGVNDVLTRYASFLKITNSDKADLLKSFSKHEFRHKRISEAREFGASVYRLLQEIGGETDLFRYLAV